MRSRSSAGRPHLRCGLPTVEPRGTTIATFETIQPHGAALVLQLPEWIVTHASGNLESIFGADPHGVIGKPIGELISRQVIHRLRNILQFVMANGEPERLTNVAMGFRRARFDLSLYADEGRAVIEIEPRDRGQRSGEEAFFLLRAMRSRLRTALSPQDICERVARHVRSVTGYDRAMVVHFLADGGGEVVADACKRQLPSRQGLRYDAESMAGQARSLIETARYCYIPDTASAPAPFVPDAVPRGGLVGLSALGLRSILPSQAEYLRRAGIGATYVFKIGSVDEPWGAVICQNEEPRAISSETRSTLDFLSNGVALQIGYLATAQMLGEHAAVRETRSKLLRDPHLDLEPDEDLSALFAALSRYFTIDGMGFWNGMRLRTQDLAPEEETANALIDLLEFEENIVFHADALADALGPGFSRDAVAGVLALRATDNPRRYLLLFRAKAEATIRWGQADGVDPSSIREEPVAGRSEPWSERDIELAYALRGKLLKTMLRRKNVAEQESSARLGHQEIIIAELNHRVKNLFAVFQSLVTKTGQNAQTPEEFRQTLSGRIRSLALAHDQVSNAAVISVRHLVEAELAPFVAGARSISIDGPDLSLAPRAVVVLALVLHELATNAEKYGAFAHVSGELAVHWEHREDSGIELEWREGGVETIAAPERRGFGSTVIERMIPFELKGTADLRYLPSGLLARFAIPAEFVVEAPSMTARPVGKSPAPVGAWKIAAQRALIVEDNMMIALEAEDMLRRLGFARADIAAHREDAEDLIRENAYDVVILDLNLGGATSLPLADELRRAGTPFLFATGYGERMELPERFADIPIVAKPYSDESLSRALAVVLGKEKSATA